MTKLLSYPRSLLMSAIYPVFLVSISAICILCSLIFGSRKIDNWFVRTWGRLSCWMFGVEIRAVGKNNIPVGGCLFLFNHASFFDIFVMASVLPSLRFGAKIELFKIPVFGPAMKRLGMLPIDRANRERVFEVYREAHERIHRGERFALAPEGTRQDEWKLGSFKAGPFVFAINTKAPVVPVVIQNAGAILPKGHLFPNWGVWKREIVMTILPAISTERFHVDERPQLQAEVRAKMEPYFAPAQSLNR